MDFHGFYLRIEKEKKRKWNALLSFSRLVHWDRRIAQIQCEQIAMNKKIALIFCLLCQTIFRISFLYCLILCQKFCIGFNRCESVREWENERVRIAMTSSSRWKSFSSTLKNPMSRHFILASHFDWTGSEQTRDCFLLSFTWIVHKSLALDWHWLVELPVSTICAFWHSYSDTHSQSLLFRWVKWNENENAQRS